MSSPNSNNHLNSSSIMDLPDPTSSESNTEITSSLEIPLNEGTEKVTNSNLEGTKDVQESQPASVTTIEELSSTEEPMEQDILEPDISSDANIFLENTDGTQQEIVEESQGSIVLVESPSQKEDEQEIEEIPKIQTLEISENKSFEPEVQEEKGGENNKDATQDLDKNLSEKPEFVTAENDDKNDTVIEENDPIGGEEEKNNMETEESILPDEDEIAEEPTEQYIVTKINEENPMECMECNKNEPPKYSCKVGEKDLYICNESCLKVLKEKKAGQIIIRDLRVKTFAVVDSPKASTAVGDKDNVCTYCNKSLSNILYFNYNCMNFCTGTCLREHQKELGSKCVQCHSDIPESLLGKYSVRFGMEIKQFCKNSCLWEYKRGQQFCVGCQEVISNNDFPGYCSLNCHNVLKSIKKEAVCAVCEQQKVEKMTYEDGNKTFTFCSEPCYIAYKFVNNIRPVQCEFCKKSQKMENLPYRFWFLDRKYQLCSKECRKLLIMTTRRIVYCKSCNVKKYDFDMISVMSSGEHFTVCSLNCYDLKLKAAGTTKQIKCGYCAKSCYPQFHIRTLDNEVHDFCSVICLKQFKDNLNNSEFPKKKVKQIVVLKPSPVPSQRNVSTMCKPNMVTKAISCRIKDASKAVQTEPSSNKFIVPIPVPIFVPVPLGMFSLPVPCPVPIPIPLPVPIFIPTTRNSMKGIQKEINRIRNKTPANPLEAEVLMMAEMVAEDKQDLTDSESDNELPAVQKTERVQEEEEETTEQQHFGEDVIQMALKMATDFDESEDLEGISSQNEDDAQRIDSIIETKRKNICQGQEKGKLYSSSEVDKPDANMCLKYTFGVNAWKQWVAIKNLELQKSPKKSKLFKSEILQTTADELNYCLCLFVNEVRKPNGSEYAPDTIYYLCLGIQQYLYENGRIDNIFCDSFYEKFTDCLQEVCQKFSLLYNESQYIVTRVEEEHLWECKQLGAHSPLVLLNTLMFFNTKHFGLTTVDEHLQLSFSHIMKHWKRNPSQPGSRSVLLRFYPPQNTDKPRKKRVYEQQENELNPIRCPVKLYEFYLSKCPESVKTRNDVFYLQPERSCVPDSPVWYSTTPLEKECLEKMLGRVKMVKEINVAILTS